MLVVLLVTGRFNVPKISSSPKQWARVLKHKCTSLGNAFGLKTFGPQALICLSRTLIPFIFSLWILSSMSGDAKSLTAFNFFPSFLVIVVFITVMLFLWCGGNSLRMAETVSQNNLSCSSAFIKVSLLKGSINSANIGFLRSFSFEAAVNPFVFSAKVGWFWVILPSRITWSFELVSIFCSAV